MNLLPAIAGGIVGRMAIRRATIEDVPACDRIARQYKDALGFVMRVNLEKSAVSERLHVCTIDGAVRGFVEWASPTRGANKGWHVVYHIATERGWSDYGIGRNLLYSVPTPIRLKCPVTIGKRNAPNPANEFYAGAGMRFAGTTQTKGRRPLNVWEMRILLILVQGNNARMPGIARASGWAYGTRAIEKARDYPVQLDLEFTEDWRAFNWGAYMEQVRYYRPIAALALDYFEPAQRETMLKQVQDLRDAGVIRIMVCPKFDGAVQDIPTDCIIAVSVPSSYAGYVPPFSELCGRRVHLLGGSPVRWFGQKSRGKSHSATGIIAGMQGAGVQVVSADGNAHTGAAEVGMWWEGGKWNGDRLPFTLYQLAERSGVNIRRELQAQEHAAQASMFAA